MQKKTRNIIVIVLAASLISLFIGYSLYYMIFSHPEGDELQSIKVNGLTRTYILHIPSGFSRSSHLPLLIALHGGGGDGKSMEKLTLDKFNELADKYGFFVAYPYAIQKHWNDGRNLSCYYSQRENVNDVAFISTLIEHLAEKYGIDTHRVYVTGMSNGGFMSFRLALEIPDKIAAIATVGALMPVNLTKYIPKPMPVLMIQGTDDPIVPWNGGYIHLGNRRFGKVISLNETVKFWVKADNCTIKESRYYLPDKDADDGTRVWVEKYLNESETKVVVYGVEGGGHTWPGGFHYLPESIIGKTSEDINACEVIWDFFKGG